MNTYLLGNDENSVIGDNMLRILGLSPTYLYKNNQNIYSFALKKVRINSFVKLLFASSVILGIASIPFFLERNPLCEATDWKAEI